MNQKLWNTKLILVLGFLVLETPVVWSQKIQKPSSNADPTRATASEDVATVEVGDAPIDLASIERRVQTVYTQVSPAIVEVFYGKHNWSAGTGVIVSAEGHVIASSSASWRVIDKKLLTIRLSDGRIVRGQALGWSNEWAIGMLKINVPERLPFAELGNGTNLAAGDRCVALGYQDFAGVEQDKLPTLSLGAITQSSGTDWFHSSCEMFAGGYSVFDLDGKLIGLTASMPPALHANVEKIREHWDQLVAGKNVDREGITRLSQTGQKSIVDKPKKETLADRSLSEEQRRKEEERIAAIIETAKLATIRIDEWKFSGVIVSEDGYVITCAHHSGLTGNELTVSLSDGREAKAVILGANKIVDAGLIKITDNGPWPYAPLGESFSMNSDDRCVKIGYPVTPEGQKLTIAHSQIAHPTHSLPRRGGESAVLFFSNKSPEMTPGASGGGVFDMQGRVVGVLLGGSGNQDRHLRVELIRKCWDVLAAGNPVDVLDGEPLADITAEFRRVADELRRCTVKVLCDGKQRVVGTIVGSDGLILTKLSELKGTLACELVDGRVFPAIIQKESREHDLAVLKIDATGLPELQWTENQESVPGTLVAAVLPGQPSKVGVICLAARPSPTVTGSLGIDLQKGDDGPTVNKITMTEYDIPLKTGDLVSRIGDHPIPNIEAYYELAQSKGGIGDAGREIRVEVRRDGKQQVLLYQLPPSESFEAVSVSRRWWGFPIVSGTDIRLKPMQCGSPLIDRHGHVVGIVIACRSDYYGWGLRHVIPAPIAKSMITK